MKLAPELSLSELQEAFAAWRQTRKPRKIPSALGANAVALLGQHRTNEILRALGIDHRTLMRWKRECETEQSAVPHEADRVFIALPAEETSPAAPVVETSATRLKVTRQARDGTQLSLEGQLTLLQWRAALSLLSAEEPVQ